MDRRTLIAITLSFLIIGLWQKFYIEPRMPKAPPASAQTQGAPANVAQSTNNAQTLKADSTTNEKKQEPTKATQFVNLETATGKLKVGNRAVFFEDGELKQYRTHIEQNAKNVSFNEAFHSENEIDLAFDSNDFSNVSTAVGSLSESGNQTHWVYENDLIKINRDISANPSEPGAEIQLNVQFKTVKRPNYIFLSLNGASRDKDPEAQDRSLLYWHNQDIQRVNIKESVELTQSTGAVKWIAATSRYFLFALIPQAGEPKALVQPTGPYAARVALVYPVMSDHIQIPLRAYFGPKELDVLRKVEPTLDHTVDFGMFTIFAYPLLRLMKGLYSIFKNWGVAIILLTLFVRVLVFPLTYKSMKSMKEMAKIQPQIKKIQEKHKDDREALNREMMTLMKSHGYNPMAGCLPILIQMPVFFALYRVFYSSIELYQAPFMLWINDLSAKDPIYVTPIFLTLVMYAQQKLTPQTTADPAQAKMLQFMPVIFGVMMVSLPSGLTLYMLVSTLFGVIQQFYMNKKLGGHATAVATSS